MASASFFSVLPGSGERKRRKRGSRRLPRGLGSSRPRELPEAGWGREKRRSQRNRSCRTDAMLPPPPPRSAGRPERKAQRTSQLDPSLQLQAGAPPRSCAARQSAAAFEPRGSAPSAAGGQGRGEPPLESATVPRVPSASSPDGAVKSQWGKSGGGKEGRPPPNFPTPA